MKAVSEINTIQLAMPNSKWSEVRVEKVLPCWNLEQAPASGRYTACVVTAVFYAGCKIIFHSGGFGGGEEAVLRGGRGRQRRTECSVAEHHRSIFTGHCRPCTGVWPGCTAPRRSAVSAPKHVIYFFNSSTRFFVSLLSFPHTFLSREKVIWYPLQNRSNR